MKRIEFIAPVEAMRGNLSGKQDLRYAENNNKAYDGPLGSVNYARNYSPRFVGAKIAKNGHKYFTVRTKSANHLTTRAKKAMALMGGTGALYASIVKDKSSQLYQQLYAQWVRFVDMGSTNSFRKSLSDAIRSALESKSEKITYAGPNGVIQFNNPWIASEQTPDATLNNAIIWKFASELCADTARKILIKYTGPAGEGVMVETFVDTTKTWASQILDGGKPLGNLGAVNGVAAGVLLQAPNEGQAQIKLGIGATTLLQTVPVFSVDDGVEEAVEGTDTPSTSLAYVAHTAA